MMGLIALIIGSITSCKQEDELLINESGTRPNLAFVGLTNTNSISTGGQLIRYNASNINQVIGAAVSITGLQTGESILAIDYRPATGILYGLGSTSRLYVLNPITGVARAISTAPFTPAISGGVAGFDFNPTVDRIRLVTKSGQNLRLNPDDGTVVATDVNINGGTNAVLSEVAYTNNTSGATATELYDVDFNSGRLYKQDANAGTLTQVGLLGVPTTAVPTATFSSAYNTNITNARPGGFDIAPTGEALVVFNNGSIPAIPVGGISVGPPASPASAVAATPGTPTLFQINLATGKVTDLGLIPFPTPNNGLPATALIGLAIAPASVAYAVDETNGLMIFNLTKPEPITKPITGLQTGESIVGLDFRPLNGQLYGLGSSSRIYTINPSSGVATAVGTLPLIPLLSGTAFGFDFNPTADAIRIVSNTGQNLRVSPILGTATLDGAINGGNVEQSAVAYSNNLVPASSTVMYTINTKTDSLYRAGTPNNGTLTRIGKLRVGADAANGFDIGAVSGIGYAILTVGTETKIYSINLSLGSAVQVGTFPKKVRAFTVGLGF
ncbi:DUF4394 domain-containing protein [Pedobacter cryophilus]|uniref:DUF4394 domain-containing protein n=2 Tax=Pedobacter cryophilus TaxID=2571271 RepID=A0A4U1BTZ1_9SPHI|nr:DUF4394 domain-containing protein [Pedobacter cryophilus]